MEKIRNAFAEYEQARKKLKTLRGLANNEASADRFAATYSNQRQAAEALRADLDQQLENLRPLTQSLIAASEHNIETLAPKKIGGIDDLSELKKNRSLEYQQTLSALIELDNIYVGLTSEMLKHGVNGASLAELTDKSNNGLEVSYNEMMEAFTLGYQDTEHLLAVR
ncbi:hypothetical protein, partial [Streptomyces sp. 021-4]|uniref:hypothetical protein n=1 Tax=Streptomyces sp. 021-4 TaxID=2789260 RepID=UPI0039F4DE29